MNDDELIELLARSFAPEPRDPPPESFDALHDAIDESVSRRRRTRDVKRWLLPAAAIALVVAGSVALVATRGSEPTRVESTSTPAPTTGVPPTDEMAAAIAALDTAIADGDVPEVRVNVRRVLLAYAALPAGDKAFVEAAVFEVLGRANAILAPATTTTGPAGPTTADTTVPPTTASEPAGPATTAPANVTFDVADNDNDDGDEFDGGDGSGVSDDEPNDDSVNDAVGGESSDGGGDGSGSGESGESGDSASG